MAEYIERDSAAAFAYNCGAIYVSNRLSVKNAFPSADVAPVRHGRWVHLGGDEWFCAACGFIITTEGSWDKPTKKYCEDCGARMDRIK